MPCRFSTQSNVTTHRGATSSIGSVEHDCGSIAPESIPVLDATEVKLPGWAVELQMCKIRSSENKCKTFLYNMFHWTQQFCNLSQNTLEDERHVSYGTASHPLGCLTDHFRHRQAGWVRQRFRHHERRWKLIPWYSRRDAPIA